MRKFLFLYEIKNNIIDSIVTQGSTKFTLRPMRTGCIDLIAFMQLCHALIHGAKSLCCCLLSFCYCLATTVD